MEQMYTSFLCRRKLLRLSVAAVITAALAACSNSPSPASAPAARAPSPSPQATSPPSLASVSTGISSATPRAATTTTGTVPPVAVTWLRDNGISLATVEPSTDFADLQPLKRIIGDARLVALGEATHGTHEFSAMKHRLVRFLITEMGFTTFALEAGLPECDRIDDYVGGGGGDPVALLRGLELWPWRTEEMRDMIDWMRAYNAVLTAGRVHFRGFDMQNLSMAHDNVLAYLRRVDPGAAAQAEVRYQLLAAGRPGQDDLTVLLNASPQVQAAYLDSVRSVYDDLAASRGHYETMATPDSFAVALQNARVVVQAVDFIAAYARKQYGVRDTYMAENVGWLLDRAGSGEKMVLWAHNEHVGATPAATDVPGAVTKSMGTWLRERYAGQYRPVGQTFYAGECNAVDGTLTKVTVPPPPGDSYETAFRQAMQPRLLLDLRSMSPGDAATIWLTGPHQMHVIGAVYDEAEPDLYFSSVRLAEKFDALVYIECSTPSHLLPAFDT